MKLSGLHLLLTYHCNLECDHYYPILLKGVRQAARRPGNLFDVPLAELCANYQPEDHPVAGPLLAGGPVELARRHQLALKPGYADACHLCYQVRYSLRDRYPTYLTPDAMYGEFERSQIDG